ncbi:MAG: ribbon-helix-helix protein, CopG family [Acidimicrobiales bacterium]
MAKRPMTVEVDESLVEATDAEARQTGRSQAEVVERALRVHFEGRSRSVVEGVWARNAPQALSEDEALALAYDELKAMRRERGTDKAAS